MVKPQNHVGKLNTVFPLETIPLPTLSFDENYMFGNFNLFERTDLESNSLPKINYFGKMAQAGE